MKKLRWILLIICLVAHVGSIFYLGKAIPYLKFMNSIPDRFQRNMHTVDLFDENFSEIRSRSDIVEELYTVNEALHKNPAFDFMEINLSGIYKEGARLKAAYFSENILNYFTIETENNVRLSDDNSSQAISVLLGCNYKSQYQIGEEIELVVRGCKTTAIVIDFLKKDQKVYYFNTPVNLNDYIILPSMPLRLNNRDDGSIVPDEYNFRLLLDKNNGLVIPKGNNIGDVKREIKRIGHAFDLPYALSVSYAEERLSICCAVVICVSLMICSGVLAVWALRKIIQDKRRP